MFADPPDVALLEERARALAAPLRAPLGAGEDVYLEFTLHGERYAIEASLVCGSFRFTDFVPLPGAGPDVVGVTLWRGSVLRVLDLARILGGSRAGLDDRAMVIALGDRLPSFGLLVSTLVGVGPQPVNAGRRAPDHEERRFIRHVTVEAVQILDGPTLVRTHR